MKVGYSERSTKLSEQIGSICVLIAALLILQHLTVIVQPIPFIVHAEAEELTP